MNSALHSVEIFALTRRIEVRWIVVFTQKGEWGGYLCCHTLSYIVDSFTLCRESQWSGEWWWAAATVWFSNAVCKLLHFESTNNIVIFWKISVLWFFFFCCNVLTMLQNIIFIVHTVCYEQTRIRICLPGPCGSSDHRAFWYCTSCPAHTTWRMVANVVMYEGVGLVWVLVGEGATGQFSAPVSESTAANVQMEQCIKNTVGSFQWQTAELNFF